MPDIREVPHGVVPDVREVPHGVLAYVEHPSVPTDLDALERTLSLDEQAMARECSARRRGTFVIGRLALRAALFACGFERVPPIGIGARGEPRLPPHISGSISHDARGACALVGPSARGYVGVDVESKGRARAGLARTILTADEERHACQHEEAYGLDVTTAFSIKEAFYKALDPVLRRFVGFREVEVWPSAIGRATCLLLPRLGGIPLCGEAVWWTESMRITSTVRVERS